jgi:sugar phosphate isomerase/epimerase
MARLGFNQGTAPKLSLAEAAEACGKHGISAIGVGREKLGPDVAADARRVHNFGLRVSSLSAAGVMTKTTAQRIDDSKRAIDQAAELSAGWLTVMGSGSAGPGEAEGLQQLIEGMEAVLPYAEANRVLLGFEPVHPMRGDLSFLVTLRQIADLLERFPSKWLGVVVDGYNSWWDPELEVQLQRMKGRIVGVQLSDWLVPMPPFIPCRGFMGDGIIDFRRIRAAVDAAGYAGTIEVEVFNREVAELSAEEILSKVVERFPLAGPA